MKKHYLILLAILFSVSIGKAQIFPYFFSVETEATYTPLSDSVTLNFGQLWDDPDLVVPLGFDFDFYDFVSDTMFITGTPTLLIPNAEEPIQPILVAYGSDIIDIGNTDGVASQSEISYKIEGSAGSQIAKIEWKNVGFYNEVQDFGTANNTMSFQVWLYEGSNDIEIHFGPNTIVDDNLVHDGLGPWIAMINGFESDTDDFSEMWYLTGDQDNPTLDTVFTIDQFYNEFIGLDNDPSDGTIYRFSTSPILNTISPIVDQNISIYPTLTKDYVTIELSDSDLIGKQFEIYDAVGNRILGQSFQGPRVEVDLQDLPRGMYFINVNTNKGFTTKKILKQ